MSQFLIASAAAQSSDGWNSGFDGLVTLDHVTITASGAVLSVVAGMLVIALAGALAWVSAVDAAAGPTEDSCLKPKEDAQRDCEPERVGLTALVGSIVVLSFSTVAGWFVQQVAPVATAAIGVSLLFTLRPVQCRCDRIWSRTLPLNMATTPWLCIAWQTSVGQLPFHVLMHGIIGEPRSEILPWTMLVTFVGAVYLCTSLETTGGPSAAARAMASAYGNSPPKLFLCLAGIASCMTVLIPDDVVTMTLAPTICLLCNSLQIDAEPHLYAQFYCANIFAVTLITGNITNVLVAGVTNDEFLSFARVMVVPGLVAGVCSVFLLNGSFSSKLQVLADSALLKSIHNDDRTAVRYRIRAVVCLCRLALAFTFAAFDSMHRWPIWLTIGMFGGVSLCLDLCLDVAKVDGSSLHAWETMSSLPFELFLFFPALFILAQQLVYAGLVDGVAGNLEVIADRPVCAMAIVGFASMWAAQAVSTAPMTIIFLQVITRVPGWRNPSAGTSAHIARDLSLYALVLGSNFCGNVSRMGTLGGQMWFRIASSYGIQLSDGLMVRRSIAIMTPAMILALTALYYSYHARL